MINNSHSVSSLASRIGAFGIAAFLLVFTISSHATPAHAGTGLTVQPIKMSYTLTPGQSVTDSINLTSAGGDAVVYPSVEDFAPIAGSNNINFLDRSGGATSVMDWVSIKTPTQFDFKQGEAKVVEFTITVPKNAEPGSHFGVILFNAVDKVSANQSLKIGTQVGVLVFVTVPGSHLQKGKIDSFKAPSFVQKGPIDFTIRFENTGTVHFEPKGTITIKNMFGRTVGSALVQGQVILPTGVRDIVATWPANLLFGPYTASINLYDGDGDLITADSVHFFALPIWYIIIFIIVFLALYAVIVFLKKKVNFSVSIKK